MINTYIVRFYTKKYGNLAKTVASLICEELNVSSYVIDHSNPCWEWFGHRSVDPNRAVSLDRHLADALDIPFIRCSRMFDAVGNPVARRFELPYGFTPDPNITVLDTDICSGATAEVACRLLGTEKFAAALYVGETQELIDVEDLVYSNSLLYNGEPTSYMRNLEFFTKRTSLNETLYIKIQQEILMWSMNTTLVR